MLESEPLKGKRMRIIGSIMKGLELSNTDKPKETEVEFKYKKERKVYHESDVASAVEWLKKRMWKDKRKFEGDKCKTSLALDYVEELINEAFEDVVKK